MGAMRAAEAATLRPIARPAAGDQDRGRRVTGSMSVPKMHPRPITAQTIPGNASGSRWAGAAAITAATGIGHGAAIPAPQPASTPTGTDSGPLTPKGSPGS